jgi:hypothetical protein
MDPAVIAAVRTIGQALDSSERISVGELRSIVMILSSYAQRRDYAIDRAAVGRLSTADEAQAAAETWYRRLPVMFQWRGKRPLRVCR